MRGSVVPAAVASGSRLVLCLRMLHFSLPPRLERLRRLYLRNLLFPRPLTTQVAVFKHCEAAASPSSGGKFLDGWVALLTKDTTGDDGIWREENRPLFKLYAFLPVVPSFTISFIRKDNTVTHATINCLNHIFWTQQLCWIFYFKIFKLEEWNDTKHDCASLEIKD